MVVAVFATTLDQARLRIGAGLFVGLALWLVAVTLTGAARAATPLSEER